MGQIVKEITRTTEIRNISQLEKSKLAKILDNINSWKILMEIIPKTLTNPENIDESDDRLKYNRLDVKTISDAARPDCLAAEILFDEWGTSGRQRPTVSHLLQLLVKAELFRAADYVAVNLLNEAPPNRPTNGPAAKIEIPLTDDDEDLQVLLSALDYPPSSNLNGMPIEESEFHQNKDHFEKPAIENVIKVDQLPMNSNYLATNDILLPASSILLIPNQSISNDQKVASNNESHDIFLPVSSILSIPNQSISNDQEIASNNEYLPKVLNQQDSSVTSQSEIASNANEESLNVPLLSALNNNQSFNVPALSALNTNSYSSIQTFEN